ncbi:MAG: hypothetical protein R6U36_05560 [Candidatus Fermentibacteraceae bacterium]
MNYTFAARRSHGEASEVLLSNAPDGNAISITTLRDVAGGSEGRRWALVHREGGFLRMRRTIAERDEF